MRLNHMYGWAVLLALIVGGRVADPSDASAEEQVLSGVADGALGPGGAYGRERIFQSLFFASHANQRSCCFFAPEL